MQQTQNLTILRYERTRSRLLEILRFFSNYDLFAFGNEKVRKPLNKIDAALIEFVDLRRWPYFR